MLSSLFWRTRATSYAHLKWKSVEETIRVVGGGRQGQAGMCLSSPLSLLLSVSLSLYSHMEERYSLEWVGQTLTWYIVVSFSEQEQELDNRQAKGKTGIA